MKKTHVKKQQTILSEPKKTTNTTSRRILEAIVLCALIFLVYSNTWQAPFISDDIKSIVDNPHIRSIFPLSRSLSAPDQSTMAGRPVPSFTLAVNYAISVLNPWSYHLANIIMHALTALLLLGILRRTLQRHHLISASPFLITLLWALHPLHTEPVNYVSTRTELLVSLFILLSLYSLTRLAKTPQSTPATGAENFQPVSKSGNILWFITSVLACVLAMFSKENAVAAPFLLLFFDRAFLSDTWKTVFSRRRWFHLLTTASLLIPAYLISQGPRAKSVGIHFANITPLDYLRTQVGVVAHYLRLAFWPHPLVVDYKDWPIARAFTLGNTVLLAVLGGLFLFTLSQAFKGKKTAFPAAWFFLILIPSSSIVPIVTEIAAERRMYLPLIAVVVYLIIAIHRLVRSAKFQAEKPINLTLVIACAFSGFLTWQRNQDYASELSIWQDTVRKRPDNSRARINLGTAYLRLKLYDEAVEHFNRSLELDSITEKMMNNDASFLFERSTLDMASIRALENLGLVCLERDDSAGAVRYLELVTAYNPDDALSFFNLGTAYMHAEEPLKARTAFEKALELNPDHAMTHVRYAELLVESEEYRDAILHVQKALKLEPFNFELRKPAGSVYLLTGQFLARLGQDADAMEAFKGALEIRPHWGDAANSQALLLATASDPEIRDPEKALTLATELSEAAENRHPLLLGTLAVALSASGKQAEARETIERALQIARHPGLESMLEELQRLQTIIEKDTK